MSEESKTTEIDVGQSNTPALLEDEKKDAEKMPAEENSPSEIQLAKTGQKSNDTETTAATNDEKAVKTDDVGLRTDISAEAVENIDVNKEDSNLEGTQEAAKSPSLSLDLNIENDFSLSNDNVETPTLDNLLEEENSQTTKSPILEATDMEPKSLDNLENQCLDNLLEEESSQTAKLPILEATDMEAKSPDNVDNSTLDNLLEEESSQTATKSPILEAIDMEATSPILEATDMETKSPLLAPADMAAKSLLLAATDMEAMDVKSSSSEVPEESLNSHVMDITESEDKSKPPEIEIIQREVETLASNTAAEENMDIKDTEEVLKSTPMEENLDSNSLDKCLLGEESNIDDIELDEEKTESEALLKESDLPIEDLPVGKNKDSATLTKERNEESSKNDVATDSKIEEVQNLDTSKTANKEVAMVGVAATEKTVSEVSKSIESTKPIKDIAADGEPSAGDVEIMDTCDSQESTNLVIDETCDTAGTREENESPSIKAAEDDADMVIQEDIVKKTKKTITLDGEIVDTIETDDQSKDEPQVNVDSKTETKTLDEGKDDDVITIEQPHPIIEIDDEDEEDEPTPSTASKSEKNAVQPMEIEEDTSLPTTTTNKENFVEDDLLTVAAEKSLEDIEKEELQKKSEDLSQEEEDDDTTDEVFYNKECINYECPHKHKQYFRVPQFAFSYFKVNKKKFKTQYICAVCYDKALDMYEEYCGLISAKQPLLLENIPSGRQEFVEIIDSSDEEDTSEVSKVLEPTNPSFSKSDLTIIEKELHDTIKSVLERVEIQNQLTWSKTILTERLKRLEKETEFVDTELKSLQRKADKMHEGLYSCPKIKIRQLQPLDLNSGKAMTLDGTQSNDVQSIPPVGEIERPPIQINGTYYAVKNNAIASWVPCKILEQTEGGSLAQKNVKYYRIKFLKSQHTMLKTVPAKYLAYYDPPSVRLPIGTRVIAYFDATSLARGREKINVQSAFYPGIIAEPLKPNNKFRYLIFYDDGYTQYVYHKDVRLVCLVSENVWEDVHPASRDFIQKYLTQYSINRPMVQTQKGQSMNTESNGYWLHARVVDIDCSLVLMQFEGSKSHTEWIYRGSLRLGPVFKEYQKTLQKNSNLPVSRLSRRTEPFIRYTEDEESSSQQQQQHQQQQQQQQNEKSNETNRAVARKTFGRPESMMNSSQPQSQQAPAPTVKHLNNSTIYVEDENKPKGKVVYYTAKRNLPPRKYKPHQCGPSCLYSITHNLSAYSPLSKPLLSGWERFILRQKIKKVVTYRAPCGKILRNMKELHHYLRRTNNVLNVDNFDFSHETSCLAEYVIESAIITKRDISMGQEKMAIPLVNYYDNTLPPECKYSAKVIPTEGVHINTDPEFFAGCDCDDDCSDKSKCSCWQLTLAGAKYGNPNTPPEEVGYQYKRLLEHVPTGIYECNPRCKCKQNCLNRVVQHSLQIKLQVFKTSNRGWGLRCINDVPRGSFVCVYAGHLLTEAKANEGGQDAGDEYFAELDYIEVAEQIKEGYESEVEPPEPEEEEAYLPDQDDDFTPSKSFLTRSKRNSLRTSRLDEDSQERQVINFNPNADMNEDSVRENSIRKLYGKDEACYVMDAKISGNLGRYFNHSCAPNMFVQNVFVDTHDLRFPWVAFFASCNIRAGTELTWNYNYEVGVVPGKVLYCQCGAANCRLRLL